MTKQCSKCKQIKDINEFAICKRNVGGRQYHCKQCKLKSIKENGYKFQKQWHEVNKEKQKEYINAWYQNHKSDPLTKISRNLRTRIWYAIKGDTELKRLRTETYTGCSWDDLKQHIEKQFVDGMSWDNYGEVWELDHIIGVIKFDLTDIKQQKQCFHYTNLQPLFKTTNIAKQYGHNLIGNRNKIKH